MRTADRAMSNVEAHPEGYNMLRRMYESVQEPLANAATAGDANPFASLMQPPVGSATWRSDGRPPTPTRGRPAPPQSLGTCQWRDWGQTGAGDAIRRDAGGDVCGFHTGDAVRPGVSVD